MNVVFKVNCPRCGYHLFNSSDVQIDFIRCAKCKLDLSVRIVENTIKLVCQNCPLRHRSEKGEYQA